MYQFLSIHLHTQDGVLGEELQFLITDICWLKLHVKQAFVHPNIKPLDVT